MVIYSHFKLSVALVSCFFLFSIIIGLMILSKLKNNLDIICIYMSFHKFYSLLFVPQYLYFEGEDV